jgi:hypothetical protein
MFFNQLDERSVMVKCVLAFEQVGQVGLADLGSRLSRLWLVQHPKSRFPHPCAKCDDPGMLSGHLDDRNMMMMSIMLSRQFWVSTILYIIIIIIIINHPKKLQGIVHKIPRLKDTEKIMQFSRVQVQKCITNLIFA